LASAASITVYASHFRGVVMHWLHQSTQKAYEMRRRLSILPNM